MTTIIRVVIIAQLAVPLTRTESDVFYHYARIVIVTDLEPLLGTIVACLPLFPPAFAKTFRRKGQKPQNAFSDSIARLRGQALKPGPFRRLDDPYPLTTVDAKDKHHSTTDRPDEAGYRHDHENSTANSVLAPPFRIEVQIGGD